MSAVPSGRRLGRALLRAGGWVLTAGGVLAILVLAGDETAGGPVRQLVAVGAAIAVLGPAAFSGAYRLLRARNRRIEANQHAAPLSRRATTAQTLLGAATARLGASARPEEHARARLGDHVRIAESTVRDLAPQQLLGFLWFARPSQPEDFPRSAEFTGLPEPVQHAIVLLDLRRAVQLRGAEATLAATSGFYHHDNERMRAAARSAGNPRLLAALEEPQPRTGALLAALDEDRTWEGLLG